MGCGVRGEGGIEGALCVLVRGEGVVVQVGCVWGARGGCDSEGVVCY